MPLFVLYLTSLDRRRVNRETTPFLAASLKSYPWAEMSNYPGNDLLPSILTGTYPAEHGVWGVTLKEKEGFQRSRWVDKLPDLVTTSAQCFVHLITGEFDLAAVPPWRRRRFEITRTKWKRFKRPYDVLSEIGGVTSIMGLVGREQCRYQYRSPTSPVRLLPYIGAGEFMVDWLELYSLNRFQQWNLHRADKVRKYYRKIDRFVELLHAKCASSGITLVLLSEHGHEAVKDSINLKELLETLGLSLEEYTFFLELSIVRFWFHTDRARQRITDLLSGLKHVKIFSYLEMDQLNLSFKDAKYGEVIGVADPGYIFFPHDFHQPLANLFLGLTDPKQFLRIFDPRQRGNCGYLPQHASEKGIMLVMDERYIATRRKMELIDVAPSLLAMLGREPPASMKGETIFAVRDSRPK